MKNWIIVQNLFSRLSQMTIKLETKIVVPLYYKLYHIKPNVPKLYRVSRRGEGIKYFAQGGLFLGLLGGWVYF